MRIPSQEELEQIMEEWEDINHPDFKYMDKEEVIRSASNQIDILIRLIEYLRPVNIEDTDNELEDDNDEPEHGGYGCYSYIDTL